jgi:hypothetical protein
MWNVRLFLVVLVFAGVTFSQATLPIDSLYVVPSAPTYKDSLSLVIVVHDASCCIHFTYDSTKVLVMVPIIRTSSGIIYLVSVQNEQMVI